MALKPCRECGKEVSTEAPSCPQCGVPDPTGAKAKSGTCLGCGKEISIQPDADCPHCGVKKPLTPFETSSHREERQRRSQASSRTVGKGTTKKEASPAARGCVGCLTVFVGLAVIGMLMPGGGTSNSNPGDRSSMAHIQCQNFVRDRLRAPSTADFPLLDREVRREASDTYFVISYVDAQNGFGATIRNNYNCRVRFRGGEAADQRNWELVDMLIQ